MKRIVAFKPHHSPLLKGEEEQGSFISMQKGQILLVVVLIMVISLTVGLSLVSRSVINLKNTSEEANSQKAFQAAEAGVEIGLQKPLNSGNVTIGQKTLDGGVVINKISINDLSGSRIVLNNGNPIAQDEGTDVWLTNYPDYSGTPWTGTVNLYWGDRTGCNDAALEIIVISGSSATDPTATINRYGIDPCGANAIDASKDRTGSNKFSPVPLPPPPAGGTVDNKTFNFSTAITVTKGIIMRIIPLYTNTPLAVVGYDSANPPKPKNFPVQGRFITSVGSVTGSTTQRQVSFFEGYPLLPAEFFYSLFQK